MRKYLIAFVVLCVTSPLFAIDFNGRSGGGDDAALTDEYGWHAENTPMDELRVVTPTRLVGAIFVGTTTDTNFWTATLTNSATAYQTGGEMFIGSSTTTNGYAILQSTRVARYIGGNANRFRAQIQLSDEGLANNQRRWGAFDGTDGAYFMSSGTVLYACTMKNGVETAVPCTSWNSDANCPTKTNCNAYEIYWTNAKVYFVIGGILKHTASFPTATWSSTMNLPARCDNQNYGNATNCTIRVRVMTIYRLGDYFTQPTSKHTTGAATTICKYGAGTLHRIVLNNPTNNAITVYDGVGAAGNVIAIINPGSSAVPVVLEYMAPFFTGLTVVTAGSPDLTIVYE